MFVQRGIKARLRQMTVSVILIGDVDTMGIRFQTGFCEIIIRLSRIFQGD